ncbi:MAG: DUF4340 domain-containing protein [Deltaproteobacteria bacterium]|nr:MAG: DUF4340 domain-containing protein [Deltaproteobacteria bacterium]
MKTIETWIYAILLIGTLAYAYSIEKGETPATKRDVVAFDPHGAQITALSWEGKKRVAHLTVEGEGENASIWVRAGRRKRLEPEKNATSSTETETKGTSKASDKAPGGDTSTGDAAKGTSPGQEKAADDAAAKAENPGETPPAEKTPTGGEGKRPTPPQTDGVKAAAGNGEKTPASAEGTKTSGTDREKSPAKAEGNEAPRTAEKKGEAAPEKTPPIRYGEPEWRSFPGNQQARRLIEDFSPLKALRAFDDLPEETLSEMGFDDPEATLTIEAGNQKVRFEVGGKAYGSSNVYMRPEGSQRVYLVASRIITPLRFAEDRLLDRNPLGFEKKEVISVRIAQVGGEREIRLEQQGRHDPANAYWTKPGEGETRESLFDDFMEKVFLLRVVRYPKETEAPDPGRLEDLFEITFTGERGKLGDLVLSRMEDPEKSQDGQTRYTWYATTPHTRSWAIVTARTAKDLAEMLPDLLER